MFLVVATWLKPKHAQKAIFRKKKIFFYSGHADPVPSNDNAR